LLQGSNRHHAGGLSHYFDRGAAFDRTAVLRPGQEIVIRRIKEEDLTQTLEVPFRVERRDGQLILTTDKGEAVAAEKLLATACDRVLAMEKGENYRWDEQKDRTIADVVRIEILQALEKMAAFK